MFRGIIEKYSETIVASFVGHSHTTWFTALRDQRTGSKPLNVEYCPGGSGPDNGSLNPTFRVYKYDTQTFNLMDFDQFIFDYREANKDESVAFFHKNYSATTAFGLKDLSAAEWVKLAESWLSGGGNSDATWDHYAGARSRFRRSGHDLNRRGHACEALMASSTPTPACSSGEATPLIIPDDPTAAEVLVRAMSSVDWASVGATVV